MKTLTAIVLAGLVAGGCATTGGDDGSLIQRSDDRLAKYEPYVGEPVNKFTAWRFDSWEPISRTQLVVRTSMNDAYLLTVDDTCSQLQFANSVGLSSIGHQVTKFDAVLVRGDRCLIRQIQPIDIRQMRADQKALSEAA
jgi:hypothetical protein